MIHVIDLEFQKHPKSIASFLVESSEGLILVESGPYSTIHTLAKGLENLGFKKEDVKHVFLTHIHFDHAGAAWYFAELGAQIYVHPFGAKHIINPEKLVNSARRLYQNLFDVLWGDIKAIPAEKVTAAEDESTYTIGEHTFKAWHTPGHANHHIAWQLGNTVFAGDVAGIRVEGGPVIGPCPPPDIHLEKWEKSIDILRKVNPKTMYLTHFGLMDGDVNKHLDALKKDLHDQASFIKARLEEGKSPEEFQVDFVKFSEDLLRKQGLSEEGLKHYKVTNPFEYNIGGWVRYWKKKAEAEQSIKSA